MVGPGQMGKKCVPVFVSKGLYKLKGQRAGIILEVSVG
jgi:hypothetical protein